jgi:hypothetical protein
MIGSTTSSTLSASIDQQIYLMDLLCSSRLCDFAARGANNKPNSISEPKHY